MRYLICLCFAAAAVMAQPPAAALPAPASTSGYVLGPGDQLLIRAWGKIELDARVTVDRNGQVN